jgi:hypothetical protein
MQLSLVHALFYMQCFWWVKPQILAQLSIRQSWLHVAKCQGLLQGRGPGVAASNNRGGALSQIGCLQNAHALSPAAFAAGAASMIVMDTQASMACALPHRSTPAADLLS